MKMCHGNAGMEANLTPPQWYMTLYAFSILG